MKARGQNAYFKLKKEEGKVFLLSLFKAVSKEVFSETKAPLLPIRPKKAHEWPLAAVRDWKDWGYKDKKQFFTKWPELSPNGDSEAPKPEF